MTEPQTWVLLGIFATLMLGGFTVVTTSLSRVIRAEVGGLNAKFDARFDGIDAKFDGIDAKFDGIDAKFEGMNGRIDGLSARMDALEKRFDHLDRDVQAIMDRLFRRDRDHGS